ncbi:membrane fusion protein, multidrug efflux system [Ectothiorhodosinus mongolicus]|uniref:Membrane fusion protein, multidrug efflux system n=1 Tax=Ectothiorhodosinus mongolicus TaxID=233100 RepID=A0A1R3W3J7_9GAMM|nr:efflux RND transporter periplasmic adaptor subunit [Ectothiorhodosinus mongolicus]SIT71165.1 membrane fusion protein, multidrug efflux system [Ectothiorhodosinus mongolicus]
MKKILSMAALAALLLLAAFWLFAPKNDAPTRAGPQGPVLVVAAPVDEALFQTRLSALGTAIANESVDITARVTAPVSAIEFVDGQQVQANRVLVRLQADQELAEAREQAVRVEEQRRELDRIRGLVADRNLPRQRLDEQQSRVSEAEARLEAVQSRVTDRVIRAPFDGVVGFRRVSVGAMVSTGTIITTLDDINSIKLDFNVPETFLPGIAVGQNIEASGAAFPDELFRGVVTGVDVRVDPSTRAAMVRAEIPNPDARLRPGMLLTVQLIKDERLSLSIPEGALLQRLDEHFVYVITAENTIERRVVTIGRRQPGVVEILEGLSAGEQVVAEGTMRVRPRSRVEVRS